jgi:hypothetical protein
MKSFLNYLSEFTTGNETFCGLIYGTSHSYERKSGDFIQDHVQSLDLEESEARACPPEDSKTSIWSVHFLSEGAMLEDAK